MSPSGRVSRGSPVQTAMRNCTRDEGRSFEAGSQVLASNRCKLLSSKAMVVSVAVNVGRISRRVRLREASASEPPMNCRKRIRRCQNRKLGPISKQGDRYLRRILVVGAHSVLRRAKQNPEKYPWLTQLLARRPFKVVAVALANKMARMAWALLAHGGTYRAPVLAAAA